VLEFRFRAIQLNQLNWRDYINSQNPVAAALMSKMKIAKRVGEACATHASPQGESRVFAATGNIKT
jgi:hypothetical protein